LTCIDFEQSQLEADDVLDNYEVLMGFYKPHIGLPEARRLFPLVIKVFEAIDGAVVRLHVKASNNAV